MELLSDGFCFQQALHGSKDHEVITNWIYKIRHVRLTSRATKETWKLHVLGLLDQVMVFFSPCHAARHLKLRSEICMLPKIHKVDSCPINLVSWAPAVIKGAESSEFDHIEDWFHILCSLGTWKNTQIHIESADVRTQAQSHKQTIRRY
jgi:hypothetical protein